MTDLDDRIRQAEHDRDTAAAHAAALRQVRAELDQARDDIRVYRNLLALAPFARSHERIAAARVPTPRPAPVSEYLARRQRRRR